MLKRSRVTIELPRNEAEMILAALDLLPKEKRTIVFDKLRANVQNVVTLYSNADRTELLRKQQAAQINAAKTPQRPAPPPAPKKT